MSHQKEKSVNFIFLKLLYIIYSIILVEKYRIPFIT